MFVFLLVFGILMIIGGISCITMPVATFTTLGWIVGGSVLIVGISGVFRFAAAHDNRSIWDLLGGIVEVLFGGLLIVNNAAQFIASIWIAYIAAAFVLVYGIMKIITAVKFKKRNKELPDKQRSGAWLAVMISGILISLVGIVCIFQPMIAAVSIGLLMGIYVLISGIENIAAAIAVRRYTK